MVLENARSGWIEDGTREITRDSGGSERRGSY